MASCCKLVFMNTQRENYQQKCSAATSAKNIGLRRKVDEPTQQNAHIVKNQERIPTLTAESLQKRMIWIHTKTDSHIIS
eukprot:6921421-Ditylum_brightwellii.AAC.2